LGPRGTATISAIEYQCQWNVNAWCVVTGNRIVGYYFIEGNLNVERYATFCLTLCGPVANLLAFGSLNVRTGSQLFGF
jgi:hypothetical protein